MLHNLHENIGLVTLAELLCVFQAHLMLFYKQDNHLMRFAKKRELRVSFLCF